MGVNNNYIEGILDIKTGDDFKVETNNSNITFEENNGSVKIKGENRNWLKNDNIFWKLKIKKGKKD